MSQKLTQEKAISFRLDDAEFEKLASLAKADGMSPGLFVRQQVRRLLHGSERDQATIDPRVLEVIHDAILQVDAHLKIGIQLLLCDAGRAEPEEALACVDEVFADLASKEHV